MENTNKDYNIQFKREAQERGFIVLNKKHLKEAAEICTNAFEGYPLYLYFKPKYNYKDWYELRLVTLKTLYKQSVILTDANRNSCLLILCNNFKGVKKSKYFLHGEWKAKRLLGKEAMKKIYDFEKFVADIRKKHTNYNSIYVFEIAVKKKYQGAGIAFQYSKFIKEFCDKYKRDVYFETHTDTHVSMYKRLGYELVDQQIIPGSKDVINYCFMYKPKK
ncbi:MAG: GNAT family N-acetyltransferase [Malacoplasma sp.]|nr:GNAT family N-acetyltransferase [Malacoplasma sp.]